MLREKKMLSSWRELAIKELLRNDREGKGEKRNTKLSEEKKKDRKEKIRKRNEDEKEVMNGK